jgi:ubiquinone/menaquinone biosynthesis methyltransferase
MFDRVAVRYDLVTDALSLGLDRLWRRRAGREIAVRHGDRVLDLGCGTGRLGALLARRATVVGIDVSAGMLARGRRTVGRRITMVQGSAFHLPFEDASFGGAMSGFVLRSLDDLGAAFAELGRVVRPGGTIALLDATEPPSRLFRLFFDAYFGTAAAGLGRLVGRQEACRYLVSSLGRLPASDDLCRLLTLAGFERCVGRPLTSGVVTLITATRRSVPAP